MVGHASDNGTTTSKWHKADSIMRAAIDKEVVPGAVMLIAQNGTIQHYAAYGVADVRDGAAMEKDAVFRICSQSKALTATAAMILWERGLLGLDDAVEDYIPEFAQIAILDSLMADTTFTTIPRSNTLTVRHLLTHTSGIPYGEIGGPQFDMIYRQRGIVDLFTMDSITAESNAQKIAATALAHEPGERWMYGLGLDILVRVIEVAAAQDYDDFLYENLLEPLGMSDTHFYLPESIAGRLVPVFEPDSTGWKIHEHALYDIDYPIAGSRSFFSGGAGLSSTAMDYAIFLQMYLNRGVYGDTRILQESTVDTIMANHAGDLLSSGDWHQGLAFGVSTALGEQNGGSPAGTFFWGGYFNTTYGADPQSGTIGILMKQTYGVANDPTTSQFNDAVFQH